MKETIQKAFRSDLRRFEPQRCLVRGEKALFSDPSTKADPYSYPFPTPTALGGLLRSIYWHPEVVYYIRRIWVFSPIRYDTQLINSIKVTSPCAIEEVRTQRYCTFLRHVEYGVEFDVAAPDPVKAIAILQRRLGRGQHFRQPCLGVREFVAEVEPPPGGGFQGLWGDRAPIADSIAIAAMPLAIRHIEDRKGRVLGGDGVRRRAEVEWFSPRLDRGMVEVPLPAEVGP